MLEGEFAAELLKYPRVIRPRTTYCGDAFRTAVGPRVRVGSAKSAINRTAATQPISRTSTEETTTMVEDLEPAKSRRNFWDELHEALMTGGASPSSAKGILSMMRKHHRAYIDSYNLEDVNDLLRPGVLEEAPG